MDQKLEPEQGEEKELETKQAHQAMELTSGPITWAKAKQLKQTVGTLLREETEKDCDVDLVLTWLEGGGEEKPRKKERD